MSILCLSNESNHLSIVQCYNFSLVVMLEENLWVAKHIKIHPLRVLIIVSHVLWNPAIFVSLCQGREFQKCLAGEEILTLWRHSTRDQVVTKITRNNPLGMIISTVNSMATWPAVICWQDWKCFACTQQTALHYLSISIHNSWMGFFLVGLEYRIQTGKYR